MQNISAFMISVYFQSRGGYLQLAVLISLLSQYQLSCLLGMMYAFVNVALCVCMCPDNVECS